MQILIAEDDGISRLILQQAIQKLGHDCLVAEDGQRAWEIFQHADTDIVISDWMMPGMDGIELCRRVRAEARAAYPYFILLTALGEKKHVLAGLEAGADDYLTKPLDRGELQVRLIAAARVTSLYRQVAEQRAELERLNHHLFAIARQDPLTQLANRLRMHEDLDTLCRRATDDDRPWCVALCDVDHFKQYNDTYGHLAGDEVLRLLGGAMAASCHDGMTAYRYGGEEFLLLLPDRSLADATAAIERLRQEIEHFAIPHRRGASVNIVTVSAGITALIPEERKSIDALLHEADVALYHAKATGRNRVAVYDPLSREQASAPVIPLRV